MPASDHPLYDVWYQMKRRCFNVDHPEYPRYGGRGITVCDEWQNNFWRFVNDVGERPPGRSLDRVNNDGNYEPSNVRWATPHEQSMNRRGISETHCPKGHPREGNTRIRKRDGAMECRICRNDILRAWRAKQ